jgi:hypothetical protein
MFETLQVVVILLAAVAMALSLAHALELPGKMRLDREAYAAVQPIYYPGFTIGGLVGEFGSMVAALVLVVVTPYGSAAFWLTLAGFFALVAAHLVYWARTHPVNNFWLEGTKLSAAGSAFFRAGTGHRESPALAEEWTDLRDRWEHSHVARAALTLLALTLLATAIAL